MKAEITLSSFLHAVYVPSRIDLGIESIRQMEISIRLFDRWNGHPVRLCDLSEDLLRRFLTEYRKSHSGATVNSKRRQLLALWNCAWEEEYLLSPPRAKRIRRAKAALLIPESWNETDVGKILKTASTISGTVGNIEAKDWWGSLLLVLYDTGERRGAALNVKSADLSLEESSIVFRHTKTGAPRWAPLSLQTVTACRKIFDASRNLVWPWPCSREWLDIKFKQILKKAGVVYGRGRGGCFHKIRRTSGTLVEKNGGDGAKHIGNTRKIFMQHYCDPRFFVTENLNRLPRPISQEDALPQPAAFTR